MSVQGLIALKDALGEDEAMREELRKEMLDTSSEADAAATAGSLARKRGFDVTDQEIDDGLHTMDRLTAENVELTDADLELVSGGKGDPPKIERSTPPHMLDTLASADGWKWFFGG